MRVRKHKRKQVHKRHRLVNRRFGSLKVLADWTPSIKFLHRKNGQVIEQEPGNTAAFLCRCDCGQEIIVRGTQLIYKGYLRCIGCPHRHEHADLKRKYPREFNSWDAMRKRCYGKNFEDYPNYGARGIRVCRRWRWSFKNFIEDMGERSEGMTLDRIDPNKGYNKTNCRWADSFTQCHNRRNSVQLSPGELEEKRKEWEAQFEVENPY